MNLWNSLPKSVTEMKVLAENLLKQGDVLLFKKKKKRTPSPPTGGDDDNKVSKGAQGGWSSIKNEWALNEPGLGFMERSWMPSAIRVLSSQAREGRWRTHRQRIINIWDSREWRSIPISVQGNMPRKPLRLKKAENQVWAHGVTSGVQGAVTTNTSAVEENKCTGFLQSLRAGSAGRDRATHGCWTHRWASWKAQL